MLPGLTELDFKRLLLSVGTHRKRRELTPCEVGFLFQKAINHGASLDQCAQEVLLDGPTWIGRFLRLLKLDREVIHLVDWGSSKGTISFTSATEIARLPKVEHAVVFRAVIENRISSKEIREIVQIRLRSNRPIEACITEVIGQRKQIVRQHMFVGAVTNTNVKTVLRSKTQLERDALLNSAIESIIGQSLPGTAKLGVDRFAIITNDKGCDVINATMQDFETVINARLPSLL